MKQLILLITLLLTVSGQLFCQAPNNDLFSQWYLTKLSINSNEFSPSEYKIYPDIVIEENSNNYSIGFADPNHIICTSTLYYSETLPEEEFNIEGPEICLLEELCSGGPQSNCYIIHEAHANFYYDNQETPFSYTVIELGDTEVLEVIAQNGDTANYQKNSLGITERKITKFTIFPNPVINELTIITPIVIKTIEVYSLTGKKIANYDTDTVDTSQLANGIYFITINNELKSIQKFIKK